MRISIFGLGYVGCTTGACLAKLNHTVIGVETNPAKVDMINSGRSPIVETGLGDLISEVTKAGKFRATTNCGEAIAATDMAMVSVGTPSRPNGSLDLRYVVRVCEEIGQALASRDGWYVVVIRSTVLPGTVEEKVIPVLERSSGKKAGRDFGVCMNPEFLRESTSIEDFFHPPKTVVGQLDQASGDMLAGIYEGIPGPLVQVPLKVAEMVKYTDNCFHALKVTFANEIGGFCKEHGIDSHKVMEIFCKDTKLNLSPYYLKPGFAFGGSCLPKDLRAVIHASRSMDIEVPMLESILQSNKQQIHKVVRLLMKHKGRRLGFFGLSFKGGTDDLRESPIVEVIESLLGKGFDVKIYDRHVSLARLTGANKEYIEREIPHISKLMCSSISQVLESCDVIVISNREPEFADVLRPIPPGVLVIDLVRMFPTPPYGDGYEGLCW